MNCRRNDWRPCRRRVSGRTDGLSRRSPSRASASWRIWSSRTRTWCHARREVHPVHRGRGYQRGGAIQGTRQQGTRRFTHGEIQRRYDRWNLDTWNKPLVLKKRSLDIDHSEFFALFHKQKWCESISRTGSWHHKMAFIKSKHDTIV